ncbi:MAG: hypothetical protein R2795_12880 [Saprospiraceae bacterium]
MVQSIEKSWQLTDASTSFTLSAVEEDDLGMQHYVWQQVVAGVPVHGNEVVTHFKNGELFLLNGRVMPTPQIATNFL